MPGVGDGSRPARASPPLCLRTLWARPREEGLLCPRVWKDVLLAAGQQSERPAVFKQLELGGWARVVCPGFSKAGGKGKKKICPACQDIGKGERARHLEWEPNCQPHKPPPDCGMAARRAGSHIHCCPAGSAPSARPPLALPTPLSKGCWHQPVSC